MSQNKCDKPQYIIWDSFEKEQHRPNYIAYISLRRKYTDVP